MVWCLNKGQSRVNEQKESSANDDKGCVKEDERRREYRRTEVERVNGETLLLRAHFCTDPCHIIRSCLSQTQSRAVKHNLMVFLQ